MLQIEWKDDASATAENDRETTTNITPELKNTSAFMKAKRVNVDDLIMEGNACMFPKGSAITTVANIEFAEVDVGRALQFLEFCFVFAKV